MTYTYRSMAREDTIPGLFAKRRHTAGLAHSLSGSYMASPWAWQKRSLNGHTGQDGTPFSSSDQIAMGGVWEQSKQATIAHCKWFASLGLTMPWGSFSVFNRVWGIWKPCFNSGNCLHEHTGRAGRAPCWSTLTLKSLLHICWSLSHLLFWGRSAASLATTMRVLPPQHTETRHPNDTLAFCSWCLPGTAARWAPKTGFQDQNLGQR